jgi:hypothetical protein
MYGLHYLHVICVQICINIGELELIIEVHAPRIIHICICIYIHICMYIYTIPDDCCTDQRCT